MYPVALSSFARVSGCTSVSPQSFWLHRKGRKGAACLAARIGLDQLNADLSQSANNRSPVPNLSIDLVSSYNFNVAFHATIDIAIQFIRCASVFLGPSYLYRFLRAATLYFNYKIQNWRPLTLTFCIRSYFHKNENLKINNWTKLSNSYK